MSKPAWGNEISEFENMAKAGVDFNDPISIAKYQATHVPMQQYGYRSGMPNMNYVDALYTGHTPTGYGKYQIKMHSPRNYNEGNYKDWFNKYHNPKNNLNELAVINKGYDSKFIPNNSYEMPIGLTRNNLTTVVGKKGQKMFDIDESFPYMDYKNLSPEQQIEYEKYINKLNTDYKTGWRGEYQEGGIKTNLRIVDEEEPTLSDEEFFNQSTEDEISDKPARSIYISDPRKIRATTGKKIRPTVDLKSGEYDADAIEKLAEYAVLRGINPYRAIAQALAESTLGTKTPDNVGHTRYGKNKNMYTNMMDAIIEGDSLAKVKGKTKPEEIIQGYNRYGKLTSDTEKDYHGGKVTGFYGVPFPKETGYLDMNKTPLYGIEVLDLQKNVLEPNEKIRSIVQPQLHPRPPKPAIQYFHKNRPEFSKGGVVAKLSQKEIDDYIKQGYIVEEE